MKKTFRDKQILVTGGTGSIGSEIVRQLLKHGPELIRVLSNDEASLSDLQQELMEFKNVRYLLGDIRQKERLTMAMEDIDFVFHAAALKHVPLCEYNPFEAINTNVIGSQNVIDAAMASNVEKCIFISTDKAVNPTSVMGATKLLAERLFIVANYYKGFSKTAFSVARFGNILNSRGSIIPLIKNQVMKGGPITITEPEMTRFIMSIPQAVTLIFTATINSKGGEIFVFKMPSLKLIDLIEVLIEELAPKYGYNPKDIERKIIGPRLGEKTHEELITEAEVEWLYENDKMFVILCPIERPEGLFKPEVGELQKVMIKKSENITPPYSSNNANLLNKKEIRELLRSIKVL